MRGPLRLVAGQVRGAGVSLMDLVPMRRSALRCILLALAGEGLVACRGGRWVLLPSPPGGALLRATLAAEAAIGALPPPPQLEQEPEAETEVEEVAEDYLTTGWGYEPPDWVARAAERLFLRSGWNEGGAGRD